MNSCWKQHNYKKLIDLGRTMVIEVALDDLSDPQALPLGSPSEDLPHLLHGGAQGPAIPTLHLLLHHRLLVLLLALLLLHLSLLLLLLLPIPRPISLGSEAGGLDEKVIEVIVGSVGGEVGEVVGGVDGSGRNPEEEEGGGGGAEEEEGSGEAKAVMPPSKQRQRPEKPHPRLDLSKKIESRAFMGFIKAYQIDLWIVTPV